MKVRLPYACTLILASVFVLLGGSGAISQSLKVAYVLKNPHGILSVCFSPNNELLACGGERTLKLIDVKTGVLVQSFADYAGTVNCVAFSPDGKLLASADDEGLIKLWDVETRHEKRTIAAHPPHETESSHDYRVLSLRFSPDGKLLASGSGGFECLDCLPYGELKLWDVQTGEEVANFSPRKEYVWSIAFSPDGKTLATASAGNDVEVLDARTGNVRHELAQHKDRVLSVAFSSDGNHLITGSKDKTVKVWDVQNWQVLRTFEGHLDKVLSVAFIDQERIVSVGGEDKGVRIWNLWGADAYLLPIKHQEFKNSVAISPDKQNFAVGFANGTILLGSIK